MTADGLRDQIRQSKTLAAVVLAAAGFAGEHLATAPTGWAAYVWRAGLVCGVAAVALLGAAIWPNMPRESEASTTTIRHWADVRAAHRAGTLAAARRRAADGGDPDANDAELVALADLVHRNYRLVQAGLSALAAAGVLFLAAGGAS